MGSSVSIHSRVISHMPTAESFTGPYTKTKRGGGGTERPSLSLLGGWWHSALMLKK